MTHHGSINGSDYDQQMKQSPTQPPVASQPPPPDATNFNYSDDPSNDTNAILKLKESMQEEVKKFDKTPNNDDYNHFGSIG